MDKLFEKLISLLPGDPFRPFLEQFASIPYLGFLNWFIPIGTCVKIGVAWLAAIAGFYAIQFLIKQIGSLSAYIGSGSS